MVQYSKLNSLDSQQTKKNWIKHCTALSFQSAHLLKLTLKEVNVCTYLMEIKVVLYSLFFSLTSILFTNLLWSLTQYHATKPMQMLETYSYQSTLQCIHAYFEKHPSSPGKSKLYMWKVLLKSQVATYEIKIFL